MSPSLKIHPVNQPLDCSIAPPGSKSLSNRALLCAALARGTTQLTGLLDCDDTRLMAEALSQLGVDIQIDWVARSARVQGIGGKYPALRAKLYCGNSGTTLRFLAASLAAAGGEFQLDGNARMRQRPVADLLAALRQLGTEAHSLNDTGCPPLEVRSVGWTGGLVSIRGDKSSQFLSGMLLAAPLAKGPVTLQLTGNPVSLPYIEMTCRVMDQFGVHVDRLPDLGFRVAPQAYQSCCYAIEPDASSASYFLAAAAICGGTVRIEGLGTDSLQGDIHFAELLAQMGCRVRMSPNATEVSGPALRGIDCAMGDLSDTVQTMAVVALFVQGPTTIRGVAHIRLKESDRLGDLARELQRAGAKVEEMENGIRITPGHLMPTEFQTYDDHRMAMSLALIGLKQSGMRIANPECVSKTYPKYFQDLQRVTGCQID